MTLVERAQKIILSPQTEWPVIAEEPATVQSLFTGYIVPLVAVAAAAGLVGRLILFHSVGGLIIGVVAGVLQFALELAGVYIVALIANALATSFNGQADQISALKWAAYSRTPYWVASIATIVPILGSIVAFVGALFSLYVFWLGTIPMMKVPQDKAVGYAVVVILCNLVVAVVVAGIVGLIIGILSVAVIGAAAVSGAAASH